jgi:hypothetical protein
MCHTVPFHASLYTNRSGVTGACIATYPVRSVVLLINVAPQHRPLLEFSSTGQRFLPDLGI